MIMGPEWQVEVIFIVYPEKGCQKKSKNRGQFGKTFEHGDADAF